MPRFGTWAGRLERFAGVGAAEEGDALEYQIELAQVAINRGGLLPTGPGTGTSRNFLPHPYSDMIYAFIIEEWGAVIGGLGLVLAYLILLYRTMRTATRCPRHFGGLLAMGLGFMLVFQAMINMAVAVRLFPTTGQPLPMVSYGGTSMIFTCLAIGMILAVSRSVTDPDNWEKSRPRKPGLRATESFVNPNSMADSSHPLNRVIVSGGGTGGHIHPALAIADEIKRRHPQCDILFVGAKGRMEMEKVPAAGYAIKGLWITGVDRNWRSLRNWLFPLKLISSLWNARRILRRFRPELVVGVGGFASGPVLHQAAQMGIPTAIQEQNSFPGITNRLLAKRVGLICAGFPGLERWFPADRIVETGNPLRMQVLDAVSDHGQSTEAAWKHFEFDGSRPVVFVMGGSLGAASMNAAVCRMVEGTTEALPFDLIWQTGARYHEAMRARRCKPGLNPCNQASVVWASSIAWTSPTAAPRSSPAARAPCPLPNWPWWANPPSSFPHRWSPKIIRPKTPALSATATGPFCSRIRDVIDRLEAALWPLLNDPDRSKIPANQPAQRRTARSSQRRCQRIGKAPMTGTTHAYFIGIGGIGMSAIARYFQTKGMCRGWVRPDGFGAHCTIEGLRHVHQRRRIRHLKPLAHFNRWLDEVPHEQSPSSFERPPYQRTSPLVRARESGCRGGQAQRSIRDG